ncbi:hypothetical protein [Chromobacterium violaceum]|uniref:Uncharacterized protein n=1 Tax=Chromobacterium violaceum TaxID=536 RepID=A0A202B5K3_CHRVL|nr:hypothetical protein [Chromobacterium violaceum]OVE46682.1 hypothetical protein CBW21_17450 [Chromobacterium violaceum]
MNDAVALDKISVVKEMMLAAVKSRQRIPYRQLYEVMKPYEEHEVIYYTLEHACKELVPREDAILEAMLYTKNNRLPASGFFSIYRNVRYREFVDQFGNVHEMALSDEDKEQITKWELKRIADYFSDSPYLY